MTFPLSVDHTRSVVYYAANAVDPLSLELFFGDDRDAGRNIDNRSVCTESVYAFCASSLFIGSKDDHGIIVLSHC